MKAYPHYQSSGTMPLDIHQSKVIKLTKRLSDELESCAYGSQCKFLNNGAEENDPNQFAIKLFDAEFCWDALGAYERQKLAAAAGLAPPVGSMITIVDHANNPLMYGYETCIAVELTDEDALEAYQLKPTDDTMREWKGPHELRRALRRLNIRGLVVNDLQDEDTDTLSAIRANSKTTMCLGGDLHKDNVRRWMNKIVCIDFGFHCVLTNRYGPTCAGFFRTLT
jgi:hypothetical protein